MVLQPIFKIIVNLTHASTIALSQSVEEPSKGRDRHFYRFLLKHTKIGVVPGACACVTVSVSVTVRLQFV